MRIVLLLLFCLISLSVNAQNSSVYEGGDVFAVKWTGKEIASQLPAGSNGKVIYNRVANSYTVTWIGKDGGKLSMHFTPVGKLEDLNLFQEAAGRQYAIDTGSLRAEGVFLALQVDLTSHTVGNKGLLITKLNRK